MSENKFQSGWKTIKVLASKLQAIISLLQILEEQVDKVPTTNEFKLVQHQLQTEFNDTIQSLINILEAEDTY